jgi:hypothetical protein
LVKRKPYASQYYQGAAYGYQQKTARLNDIDLKLVEKYEYLGVVLNNSVNYDAQWEVYSSKTNPHIYLLKILRRMGFKEDKLVCVYKSLNLSQYIYGAPLLASASTRAKNGMQAQKREYPQRELCVCTISSPWRIF